MPDLTDPNRASDRPLMPMAPRWQKRGLGVLVVAAVVAMVAVGAWYFKYRTPASDSGSPGVFERP